MRAMASHPFTQFLTFLFLLHSAISHLPSLSTTPLAYRCGPPLQTIHSNITRSLLQRLTTNVSCAQPATITMAHQQGRIDGLVQCRPDLSSTACNLCLQAAKDTVTDLCPNSGAATAWFDGCYIHYFYHTSNSTHEIRVHQSRSNQTQVTDRTHFAYALDALLLRLTADVHLPSRRGFSSGVADYGDGRQVYALAECLEFVTFENCVACVTQGVREVQKCCGGSEGGTVVAGSCLVRFESYRFFSSGGRIGDGGSDSSGPITSYDIGMEGDDCRGFKVKVAWVWSVGVACFVGVAFCVWVLRRKIISIKVATYPLHISEQKL